MKTEAIKVSEKLRKSEPLTNDDRTFLLGFIYFALEFQEYVKGNRPEYDRKSD